ncbi:unnamed protein product [Echinostoma caproni]|uniref:SH3 domain-containing protein n=1 Tax=Echinostoma caproni TaxID=27848 RepID=A0A183A5G5_9TREM|nr:unnamed protein product [Echinostoma caproni]
MSEPTDHTTLSQSNPEATVLTNSQTENTSSVSEQTVADHSEVKTQLSTSSMAQMETTHEVRNTITTVTAEETKQRHGEDLECVELVHPDGTISAVSAHPPTVVAENNANNKDNTSPNVNEAPHTQPAEPHPDTGSHIDPAPTGSAPTDSEPHVKTNIPTENVPVTTDAKTPSSHEISGTPAEITQKSCTPPQSPKGDAVPQTLPTAATTTQEVESNAEVQIYREDLDVIETTDADGIVSAVSAHPPSAPPENAPVDQTRLESDKPLAIVVSEKSPDHSDIHAVSTTEQIGNTGEHHLPDSETDDKHLDVEIPPDITEAIMHVPNPCTEVPEPVETPRASRSKVSESRGGENGPELNMAHLVDAVDIREATVEDIPPLKPVTPETTHHVDRPKRPPPPAIMTTACGVTSNGTAPKKAHAGFHFRLGGSKSRDNSGSREGSLDRQNRRSLGASMRNAFGTLTRSIKKKQSELQEKRKAAHTFNGHHDKPSPAPPGERIHVTLRSPSNEQNDQEEQSLQSVSGVCLSHESVSIREWNKTPISYKFVIHYVYINKHIVGWGLGSVLNQSSFAKKRCFNYNVT